METNPKKKGGEQNHDRESELLWVIDGELVSTVLQWGRDARLREWEWRHEGLRLGQWEWELEGGVAGWKSKSEAMRDWGWVGEGEAIRDSSGSIRVRVRGWKWEPEGGWQLREWMWEWLGFSIVRGIYILGYFSNFNLYGSGQVGYA